MVLLKCQFVKMALLAPDQSIIIELLFLIDFYLNSIQSAYKAKNRLTQNYKI